MVVTLHSTIHDSGVALLSDAFLCHFVVNPFRITPHGIVNFAEFHRSTCIILHGILESVIKIAVVQEHIRIVEPSVEMSLN